MDEQAGPENSLNQTKIASCAVFFKKIQLCNFSTLQKFDKIGK